jgi:hypothetical protein
VSVEQALSTSDSFDELEEKRSPNAVEEANIRETREVTSLSLRSIATLDIP